MRHLRFTLLVLLGTMIILTAKQACTETILISPPLPGGSISGGSGGVTCACTNLTKKTLSIRIEIQDANGGGAAENKILPLYSVGQLFFPTTSHAVCWVSKQNQKNITPKQVSCSFSSEDDTGRLIVPVDKKLKR